MTNPGDLAQKALEGPPGAEVIYLLDASSDLEARMLEDWLGEHGETAPIPSSREKGNIGLEPLRARIGGDSEDRYLIPARVVWMAPERKGRRSVGWADALRPGDPREPKGLQAWWIRTFHPDRVKLIVGAGAYLADLAADQEASEDTGDLAAFVTRRAWRTLDRAERKLRGNRYKIPRFVPEAILSRREFIEAVHRHAAENGVDPVVAMETAEKHLREMAATHSPYVIDLIANAIHSLYRQGYRAIRYNPDAVAEIAELGSRHPVVFLPSHRSNLDRLALQFMLWENDLPPNHTAGGVNIDFFPVGPLIRRTGVFFIRRSFRDDELYKIVLKAYIDYLVEKRFPLEWYMEGGRSRSGRLLPAKFGLLSYVVDSLRRGKADDVLLIPVSIVYDHIQDVPDYAREAQGRGKERESVTWLLRAVRSLRRSHGNIHIRFAEPVSVSEVLDTIAGDGETSIGLQKLAFEVMHRIGQATPITPTAIVSIALLASDGATTAPELAEVTQPLVDYVSRRELPVTESVDLSDPGVVAANLDWLAEHGNVSSHEALGRKVFWLTDEQMIRISYYRNVVLHFFVNRAIAEIALRAWHNAALGRRRPVRDLALAVRDLLKFEFYFPEREEFVESVISEIALEVPEWERLLGDRGADAVLSKMGPPMARWALLPILDGYRVGADELVAWSGPFSEKQFLKRCLARAKMYRIEGDLEGESVSQALFKSALLLAENRGLLESAPGVAERRHAFANEVGEVRELASYRG